MFSVATGLLHVLLIHRTVARDTFILSKSDTVIVTKGSLTCLFFWIGLAMGRDALHTNETLSHGLDHLAGKSVHLVALPMPLTPPYLVLQSHGSLQRRKFRETRGGLRNKHPE